MMDLLMTTNWPIYYMGLALIICFIAAFFYIIHKPSASSSCPKDVVVLYQVGRGPRAPSSSPFPLKLETFLRMYKIPYTNDHTGKFSSKGKTPWIKYNGISVADSELSIGYLKQVLQIPDEPIEASLKAAGRAFQKMCEENLYWTMCHSMFVSNQDKVSAVLPRYKGLKLKILLVVLSRVIRLEMWGHGIGRHSPQDIYNIGQQDLSALSAYLGNKSFFLGDEPREVDCSIFAMIAQVAYHMPGTSHERLVHDVYPNLLRYCERMEKKFWPDWKERCFNTDKMTDDMSCIYFTTNKEISK